MDNKVVPVRQITVNWHQKFKNSPKKPCVYRIWYGDKCYIGRSVQPEQRRKNHINDLNKRLRNGGEAANPNDYYQHILSHLKRHPEITEGRMEVIKYCATEDELVAEEQKWLDKYVFDQVCLNLGYEAKRYDYERKPYTRKPVPKKPIIHKRFIPPLPSKKRELRKLLTLKEERLNRILAMSDKRGYPHQTKIKNLRADIERINNILNK